MSDLLETEQEEEVSSKEEILARLTKKRRKATEEFLRAYHEYRNSRVFDMFPGDDVNIIYTHQSKITSSLAVILRTWIELEDKYEEQRKANT